MFNTQRKNDASPGCCSLPPGQLIKPRHNLKLIARQMEEQKRLAVVVVVSITGGLGDLTARVQFVIKIIYVTAWQYRASLISQKNTNINIYPPHWF